MKKKHLALIFVSTFLTIILTTSFTVSAKVISKYGKGFLEENQNGLRILHVCGTAYERGYQHGYLLKDEIEESLNSTIAAWAVINGDGDYETGLKKMIDWKNKAVPFIPPEFKREMMGISDALKDKGSNLDYNDIVMWNTHVDIACMPGHEDANRPGIRQPYPTDFCIVWGAYGRATTKGQLVVGKNFDWSAVPQARKNSIVMIGAPTDGGHGFIVLVYPGMVGNVESMNEVGIFYGGTRSPTTPETMMGLCTAFKSRMLAQYADSIEDAITILTAYGVTVGENTGLLDGKACQPKEKNKNGNEVLHATAAVIETTSNEISVRYPEPHKDIIWSTNHFNCYPGWQGYNGYNMVTNQAQKYKLDISTIETWQASLAKNQSWTWSRYERLKELLNDSYGKINVEKGIEIMRDRYDINHKRHIGPNEVPPDFSTLISVGPHPRELSADVPYYKSGKRGSVTTSYASQWSVVATPETGDIWIAQAKDEAAAQQGKWIHLNLKTELEKTRSGL